MCKRCRDPSDVLLGRKYFSAECDCDCDNQKQSQGAVGMVCEKCGDVVLPKKARKVKLF